MPPECRHSRYTRPSPHQILVLPPIFHCCLPWPQFPTTRYLSSLASPAFPIDQVTTAPLPLLATSTTAILPAPPQGTSASRPNISTANDGIVDDPPGPDLRYHAEALEQSRESVMSIPEVATDVLRHPLDAASVSHDIDHPE
jgi:hypothetical protein